MKKTTPQRLGRTTNAFELDQDTAFGLIGKALERTDFRACIAFVAMWELKELADRRVAKNQTTWGDEWPYIFEPHRLAGDLASDNAELRKAARRAEAAVGDLIASMHMFMSPNDPDAIADAYERIVLRARKRFLQIERVVKATNALAQSC
jgi:hypothetical protein